MEASTPNKPKFLWIITGPAGCGKTSVAQYLSEKLLFHYIEGDEFHPPSNIAKMANGIPLTDDDRWSWLETLRNKSIQFLAQNNTAGCVLTCSCLKKAYRNVLREANETESISVRFVYLKATEELLLARVCAREGHYMKADMVHSQFLSLEEPDETETDIISVDVSSELKRIKEVVLTNVKYFMQ